MRRVLLCFVLLWAYHELLVDNTIYPYSSGSLHCHCTGAIAVKYRIEFKTLLIVSKGLHGKAPTYIQEMITPSKSKRYSIGSNEERALKVPKFKHDTFSKSAFAVYGPLAWNCLPKEIRLCDEIEAFKRNLKTHLFVKFVNESTLAIWFWRIIIKRPIMLSVQFVALYKFC